MNLSSHSIFIKWNGLLIKIKMKGSESREAFLGFANKLTAFYNPYPCFSKRKKLRIISCDCFFFFFSLLMMVPFPFQKLPKYWYSLKEYEEKAVSLALDRPKLQDLSNKLKAARMTCPLFDTPRWVSIHLCLITMEILFLFLCHYLSKYSSMLTRSDF